MSDLFGDHIVGFPKRRLHYLVIFSVAIQSVPGQHGRCVDETYTQTGGILRLLPNSDQGHVEG